MVLLKHIVCEGCVLTVICVLCCWCVHQVRAIGRLLGVPDTFIKRHPFPGPGMGVRILGDVTEGDRLEVRRRRSVTAAMYGLLNKDHTRSAVWA